MSMHVYIYIYVRQSEWYVIFEVATICKDKYVSTWIIHMFMNFI